MIKKIHKKKKPHKKKKKKSEKTHRSKNGSLSQNILTWKSPKRIIESDFQVNGPYRDQINNLNIISTMP